MDILTHTLSGLAIGTVVAVFSKKGFSEKLKIVTLSGIAGALPDIDAISLWSGFDSSFGELFGLKYSGKDIYSAKFWYSHHAFFHSLFAGILFAVLIGIIGYFFKTKPRTLHLGEMIKYFTINKLLYAGFILGYFIHLVEDMPTPASSWGGVNLFWPIRSYVGGSGEIWWWNNYDIFLIVVSVLILNTILMLVKSWVRFDIRKIVVGFFVVGLFFCFLQVKTRKYDFAYSGHTKKYQEYEKKSKELQKDILGERLFNFMESFDKKLMIYF